MPPKKFPYARALGWAGSAGLVVIRRKVSGTKTFAFWFHVQGGSYWELSQAIHPFAAGISHAIHTPNVPLRERVAYPQVLLSFRW
jgi:hypothetical protein